MAKVSSTGRSSRQGAATILDILLTLGLPVAPYSSCDDLHCSALRPSPVNTVRMILGLLYIGNKVPHKVVVVNIRLNLPVGTNRKQYHLSLSGSLLLVDTRFQLLVLNTDTNTEILALTQSCFVGIDGLGYYS